MKPCVIIPTYNNTDTIVSVVESVKALGLPCIVVNDGSDERSTAAVRSLTDVDVIHFPWNMGKGAAVCHGLVRAAECGFTHAVQIDADAQHDTSDIPRFLDAAREDPRALILGAPVFDETAPAARRYGRMFNHPWIWLETRSLQIKDALCGFRVYPVESSVELIRSRRLGARMEFDPEIAVRLVWRGVPVRNVATRVRYFSGGVSHFRVFRDNARITWLHTRLILSRLATSSASTQLNWSAVPERGTTVAFRTVAMLLDIFGVRVVRAAIHLVLWYFFLSARYARHASREYWSKIRSSPPSLVDQYRQFYEFAVSIVDRIAAWRGLPLHYRFVWHGQHHLHELVARGQGAVILGAHLGNLDLLRAAVSVEDPGVVVHPLMFTSHAQRFQSVLREASAEGITRLIPTESVSPQLIEALQERIGKGEFIAMFADRILPGSHDRSTSVSFLGSDVKLPQGPFVLSSLLQCPVVTMFALRRTRELHIHFEPFVERLALPRGARAERLTEVIQRFAERLERHCREVPHQWFNFYSFWRT